MTDDGVVVDVVFETGLLYLELANLSDRPALNVAASSTRRSSTCRVATSPASLFSGGSSSWGRGGRPHTAQLGRGLLRTRGRGRVTVVVDFERPDEKRRRGASHTISQVFRELTDLA